MHDRAGVVLRPQVVVTAGVVRPEPSLHPSLDVAPVDGDVTVPVHPVMFVPEAYGMQELVEDDLYVNTVVAQTELLSRPGPPDSAVAVAAHHDVDVTPV